MATYTSDSPCAIEWRVNEIKKSRLSEGRKPINCFNSFILENRKLKDTIKIIESPIEIVLQNLNGLKATITNYGATLMRLEVPDKQGTLTDVVIGLPNAEDYTKQVYQEYNFYLGATIGRYAGRISKGGFYLNDRFYPISHNNNIQLHGGVNSIDKRLWTIEDRGEGSHPFVELSTIMKDGENGFPGNVKVFAKYELTIDALKIAYTATTDAPTVVNLTNHAYFNLSGKGSTEGNDLHIAADRILEVDECLIPTGRMLEVHHTPLNYLQKTPLHFKGHYGLDTPFALNESEVKASLYAPGSGIEMKVLTNQPALVVFTPRNFASLDVRNREQFSTFPAICFECQNFPDAPNQPDFPSSVLLPGETYRNEMEYRFKTK